MRKARTALLVAAVLTTGVVTGVQAATPRTPASRASRLVVTGQALSPMDYLRRGLTVRQSEVLAPLDRLAAQGADRRVIQSALDAASQDVVIEGGSSAPTVEVDLTVMGDLDGRPGADVVESRFVSAQGSTTALFVARDGATGAVLWSRTDRMDKGAFVFPVSARVGAHGRPGVVLYRGSFEGDHLTTLLTALDGAGRTRWTRSLSFPGPTAPDPGPLGYSFSGTYVYTIFDRNLTRGGRDLLVLVQRMVMSDNGVRWSVQGDAQFSAIAQTTGVARTATQRYASSDGFVNGDLAGDQTGDGLEDLTMAVGGSTPRVAVLRGYDAAVVWSRTDLPAPLYGDLMPAEAPTDGSLGAPALVYVGSADPGKLRTDGVFLPLPPYEVPVQDPTRGAHGVVAMLAARTGKTVWSRAGDMPYLLASGRAPEVGVALDNSSAMATSVTAALRLDVVRTNGTVAWTHGYSQSQNRAPGDDAWAFSYAFPLLDLDGDGLLEGRVVLVSGTSDVQEKADLIGSERGQLLADQSSDIVGAGLTRSGSERFRLASSAAGETLTVLRGRDGRRLFTRLVPGSKGINRLSVWGARLGAVRCADVLASGVSKTRAVLAVLANDGSSRWWVSGLAADLHPQRPVHPAVAPRPHC